MEFLLTFPEPTFEMPLLRNAFSPICFKRRKSGIETGEVFIRGQTDFAFPGKLLIRVPDWDYACIANPPVPTGQRVSAGYLPGRETTQIQEEFQAKSACFLPFCDRPAIVTSARVELPFTSVNRS